jgi:hypothetical protein
MKARSGGEEEERRRGGEEKRRRAEEEKKRSCGKACGVNERAGEARERRDSP